MAYKKWAAGEALAASDLNTAIEHSIPHFWPWFGKRIGDLVSSSADCFAMTASGRYLLQGSSTNWYRYDAYVADSGHPRNATATVAGLSITPNMCARYTDSGTEYIIAAAAGGTDIYRYANDGSGETTFTFSGTAITTGARRMGWDPNTGYIYIMDGANKAATAVKRYTVSGTVLTYVDTITLSAAPANLGSTCMFIGASYLCIDDSSDQNRVEFDRYGKASGTLIDSFASGGTVAATLRAQQLVIHPNKHAYILMETSGDSSEDLMFIRWSVDAVA